MIKNADFLSSGFNLTFSGNDILATVPGGIISFIVMTICFLAMLKFIQDYLDTSEPKLTETLSLLETSPEINLWDFKYTSSIFLRKSTGSSSFIKVEDFPKYITPVAII